MSSESPKLLLTGLPGCGKTTAVMRIITELKSKKTAGFYTEEIRQNKSRKGFRWISLDGDSGILAHVDVKGPYKVGKYGVDVTGFEKSVVPVLDIEQSEARLFVIDEIGKMECMSARFVNAVRKLFASDSMVLATVAQKGSGLIRQVKEHPDARLFTLNRENYDSTIQEILQIISFLKNLS